MKAEQRLQTLQQLKTLSLEQRRFWSERIYEQLFHSSAWQRATTIACTSGTNVEIDTWPIIERAWTEGKVIALPISDHKTRTMAFHRFREGDDLTVGFGHIKEPLAQEATYIAHEQFDLIIVPGVVFNEAGYRIGFGGGYYDRFLAPLTSATVALCYELQLQTIVVEPHDRPVEQIMTEERTIDCLIYR